VQFLLADETGLGPKLVADNKLKDKIGSFIEKLAAGNNVQNRDLATWLGDDWVAGLEQAWIEQKEIRQEFAEKPEAVLEYEARFKTARLLENRANGYSLKRNSKQARIFHEKAEVAFERLLERFHELTAADYSLHTWFDRMPDFSTGNEPSLCADAMPQVRTSRSLSNTSSGHSMIEKKRALKMRLLKETLAAMTYVDERTEEEVVAQQEKDAAKLDKFLKNCDQIEY
jgi:hypothetical protein